MGDPVEDDNCNKVSKNHGTSTGGSAEYNWDMAFDQARVSARTWAAIDAERWAMTIPCPPTCSYREMKIEIGDPSSPEIKKGMDAKGHRIWEGKSHVDWNATVTCVKALPPDGGTVEGEGTGVTDGREHRRAKCNERIRFDGTSKGEGSSIVQVDPKAAAAIAEAKNSAQQQAYLDANQAALAIRCPYKCGLRTISITTSRSQAGKRQKYDVQMPGILPLGGKKMISCWLIEAKCQWKVRVTCHD